MSPEGKGGVFQDLYPGLHKGHFVIRKEVKGSRMLSNHHPVLVSDPKVVDLVPKEEGRVVRDPRSDVSLGSISLRDVEWGGVPRTPRCRPKT